MYKNTISFCFKSIKCQMFCTSQLSSYPKLFNQSRRKFTKIIDDKCLSPLNICYKRHFCVNKDENSLNKLNLEKKPLVSNASNINKPEVKQSSTIFKRFKETYAAYGKLCIAVHLVTYCGWFVLFYCIIRSGIDIKAIFTTLHFPESVTNLLGKPGLSEIATVYVLCKIFMVFRYALTIYLTKHIGKHLRRLGYMAPIKEENKIRNLASEGKELSKQKIKESMRNKFNG